MALLKTVFWGMLISFLGTLPLSPLNLTAMQLSLQEGVRYAMYFSVGTIVSEVTYVRIGIVGLNWLRNQKVIFKWMEWITLVLIVALAFGSFYAASHNEHTGNLLLNNHINRFVLGMIMSALTVMHIPFWFGWSTILFTKNVLRPNSVFYNFYIAAIGIGTFLANCIFIYGGPYIVKKISNNQHVINLILGWVFVLTALIQFIKIIWFRPPE